VPSPRIFTEQDLIEFKSGLVEWNLMFALKSSRRRVHVTRSHERKGRRLCGVLNHLLIVYLTTPTISRGKQTGGTSKPTPLRTQTLMRIDCITETLHQRITIMFHAAAGIDVTNTMTQAYIVNKIRMSLLMTLLMHPR